MTGPAIVARCPDLLDSRLRRGECERFRIVAAGRPHARSEYRRASSPEGQNLDYRAAHSGGACSSMARRPTKTSSKSLFN
jgi:hypothetical protein